MESIAAFDDREAAREKFDDWCQMKAEVHHEFTFVGRHGDVATIHISTGDPAGLDGPPTNGNHRARDFIQRYAGGNPVRVIDVSGVEGGVVEVQVLLANLRVD